MGSFENVIVPNRPEDVATNLPVDNCVHNLLRDIVLIPMKVVSDSDLIPVTCSEVMAVVFGAKRRWRSYHA
jgi:hypothetical protein